MSESSASASLSLSPPRSKGGKSGRGGKGGFRVSPVKAFALLLLLFFVALQLLTLYSRKAPSDLLPPPPPPPPPSSHVVKQHVRREPSGGSESPEQSHSHSHSSPVFHRSSNWSSTAQAHYYRTRHLNASRSKSDTVYKHEETRSSSTAGGSAVEGLSAKSLQPGDDLVPVPLQGAHMMSLPGPALDKSELVMSALIERTSRSSRLHLTTFFLNAAMVAPHENRQNKAERIRPDAVGTWKEVVKKLSSVAYLENGKRSPRVPYFCRVFNSQGSVEYKVPGEFVPNRQTTDPNTNRRVDVFRCPLKFTDTPVEYFARVDSHHTLFAEVYRKDTVIARFSVPWNTRRVGYLMSPVITNAVVTNPSSSSPGQAKRFRSSALRTWPHGVGGGEQVDNEEPQFHLCVVGLQPGQMTQGLLGQMIEFIEYHIQVGVAHMYFAIHFSEKSLAMIKILEVLDRYIDDGYVSISTTAGDDVNMIDSFSGIKWNALSTDTFVINSCLYLSKGVADYLGVWDLNEFFVPRSPHNSVMDVVRSVSTPNSSSLDLNAVVGHTAATWTGGRGWADGNAHPFCYLNLHTADAYVSPRTHFENRHFEFDMSYIFAFDAASTRPNNMKAILPTAILFQAGILSPGVCQLEPQWANCDPELLDNSTEKDKYIACITNDPSASWINRQTNNKLFQRYHEYDDVVTPADGKAVHMENEGYLFRLNAFKQDAPSPHAVPFHDSRFSSLLHTGEKSLLQKFMNYKKGANRDSLLIPIDFGEKRVVLETWPAYSDEIKFDGPIASDPADVLPVHLPEEARVKFTSSNGYHNFKENFARPDILENPTVDELPAFAKDYTDIAVGSIIERKHASWDLHLTTFFLNHNFFWQPIEGYGMGRISKKNKAKWEKIAANFNKTHYSPDNGRRVVPGHANTTRMVEEVGYKCRIRNSNRTEDVEYIVSGVFMPNKLTPDMNANNRLDILRCKIQAPKSCYHSLSTSDHSAEVTIVSPSGEDLFHFKVPWKTRRTGYLLSAPAAATSFKPWKAFDSKSPLLPGEEGGDMLYMSVPGIESTVSQFTLPMYLEFLQHHYLLGVEHVFMAGSYAWNGAMMSNFLVATQSFIADGLLSVNSQAGDNFDLLYSFLGGSLDRDTVKIFHVNMYLYLTKGMVDYLGVWDIDEYFIPQLPHHTILDVIRAAEAPAPLTPFPLDADPWEINHKPGPGWADGDAHPFCYLMLSSECIFSSLGYPEVFDPMKPWYKHILWITVLRL